MQKHDRKQKAKTLASASRFHESRLPREMRYIPVPRGREEDFALPYVHLMHTQSDDQSLAHDEREAGDGKREEAQGTPDRPLALRHARVEQVPQTTRTVRAPCGHADRRRVRKRARLSPAVSPVHEHVDRPGGGEDDRDDDEDLFPRPPFAIVCAVHVGRGGGEHDVLLPRGGVEQGNDALDDEGCECVEPVQLDERRGVLVREPKSDGHQQPDELENEDERGAVGKSDPFDGFAACGKILEDILVCMHVLDIELDAAPLLGGRFRAPGYRASEQLRAWT
jgi:hypothetical protein